MTIAARWTRVWQRIITRRWHLLALFTAVLLPLWLFGELSDEVIDRERLAFDDPLLRFLHRLAAPGRDRFMLIITELGYGWGVVPLMGAVLLVLLVWNHLRDAVFWGLAVGGALLLNGLAKALFGRARPQLWPSIAPETSFSFPSGHAMASMACVLALVVVLWPTRWRTPVLLLGSLFVLLVGVSRVYLGVHYPSDILAGWAASFAWVVGVSGLLYGRIGKPAASPRHAARAADQTMS